MSGTTCDGFLGGRLTIEQPKAGYRAGADPVLLAAAVEVASGAAVLELGCGAGTALLCLGWRVPGLALYGLEQAEEMAALARANAARNAVEARIVTGDVARMPASLRALRFDAVLFNPPFFDRARGTPATGAREEGRGEAGASLETWIAAASRRLAPRGQLCLIHRSERLPQTLAALDRSLGGVTLRPVAARAGGAAERFILSARKGARHPFRLLAPLVLHDTDGTDSPAAHAILRDGAPLEAALLTNR